MDLVSPKRRSVFYGWLVVAGAFTVSCVGFGCVYSFAAFVKPLEHEFGGSRGSVSLVFSFAGFLYFSLGSISGPLADRLGSRRLAVAGDPMQAGGTPHASGASLREAIKSRRFIGLYAACLACSFAVFVPFVHLVPYALDHGMTEAVAVWLVSAIGVGSTLGRFFLGGVADRFGRELSLTATFVGMALAMALWLVSTAFWPLALFAFLFGTAYGGWVALLPAVVMDYFGGRNVSGIIGLLYTSVSFGTLIGPSAAGFTFDLMHSYTLPIAAGIGFNIIAAAVIAATSRPALSPAI